MPDIGNTTIPSPTQRSCNGELRGILITMPEAGTLDSITAYCRAEAGHSMFAYLYDSSGNLLAQSAERTDISATAGYHTFTFSGSPSLANATDYIICVGADSANTAEQWWEGSDVTENTFPGRTTAGFPAFTDATTPPDPATFSVDASRFFIMYATYTVAASGQTIAIGQISETELAQPLTPLKTVIAGQVSETNLAQALAPAKQVPILQVTETDLAQAISMLQGIGINQVIEADAAFAFAARKLIGMGQVEETTEAATVPGLKTVQMGQVSESNLAQGLQLVAGSQINQVVETNTAQPMGVRRVVSLALVAESDQAFALSLLKAVEIGSVTETDLAQSIGVVGGAMPAGYLTAVVEVLAAISGRPEITTPISGKPEIKP